MAISDNWTTEETSAERKLQPRFKRALRRVKYAQKVRTRDGGIRFLQATRLVPDWWPCLCNGGEEKCPICHCGLEQEPQCGLCGGEVVELDAPGRHFWDKMLDDEEEAEQRRIQRVKDFHESNEWQLIEWLAQSANDLARDPFLNPGPGIGYRAISDTEGPCPPLGA